MEKGTAAIKERLIKYFDYKGINRNKEFFESVGISKSGFVGVGLTSEIGGEALAKIMMEFKDLNGNWVLRGIPPMIIDTPSEMSEITRTSDKTIPLININLSKIDWDKGFNIDEVEVLGYYVLPKFDNRGIEFLHEVIGSSMAPLFKPGDFVGCRSVDKDAFIQWNAPHLVVADNHGLIFSRIKPGKSEDSFTMVSYNSEYDPFDVPKDNILAAFTILGSIS